MLNNRIQIGGGGNSINQQRLNTSQYNPNGSFYRTQTQNAGQQKSQELYNTPKTLQRNETLREKRVAPQFQNSNGVYFTGWERENPNQNYSKKRTLQEISVDLKSNMISPISDKSTIKPGQNTIIRNPTMYIPDYDLKPKIKDQSMKPINLSKSQFNQRDSFVPDGDYYSAVDHINKIPQRAPQIRNEQDEKMYEQAALSFQKIISELSKIDSDPFLSDLSLTNSKGQFYEYATYNFMACNQIKIPSQILRDINIQNQNPDFYFDCGFLSPLKVMYFCVNKNLHLWAYDTVRGNQQSSRRLGFSNNTFTLSFDQKVTTVSVAKPFKKLDNIAMNSKILIGINLIYLKNNIVCIVSMIKTYVIDFNEQDGRLLLIDMKLDLPIEDKPINKILQMQKNGRIFFGGKDIHVNELTLQDNSLSFLSLFVQETKRLKKNDLQEQSIFQKLVPNFLKLTEISKNITDIKIDESRNYMYSLSDSLSYATKGQAIIEVFDLGILGNQFQRLVQIKQTDLVRVLQNLQGLEDYAFKGLNLQEISTDYHIQFIQPIMFNESQCYHLLIVTQNGLRLYIQFETKEIDPPSELDIERAQAQSEFLVTERFTSKWKIVEYRYFPNEETVLDQNFHFQVANNLFKVQDIKKFKQKNSLQNQVFSYSNFFSFLVYGQNELEDQYDIDQVDPDYPKSGIKINFIMNNESALAHYKQIMQAKPQEIDTFKLSESYTLVNIELDLSKKTNQQRFPLIDDDQDQNLDNEAILEILAGQSGPRRNEVANLLGFYRDNAIKDDKTTCYYQMLPLSSFEKQVYLEPNKVEVLTNHRLIEILQMRPIDLLANILNSMVKLGVEGNGNEDFEDFVVQYSIREICAMLVQILSEPKSHFLMSIKIDILLQNSKKRKRLPLSQPRQMNRSQLGGFQPSARESLYNRNINIVNYNFNRQQNQSASNSNPSNAATSSLFYQIGGVNTNEYYEFRTTSPDIRQVSLDLLIGYGNSISSQINIENLKNMMRLYPESALQFSYKHQALYTYIQRVLRPVWELKITFQPDAYRQILHPTFLDLTPVKIKLEGLNDFLIKQEKLLYGDSTDYHRNIVNIENTGITSQIYLIQDLHQSFKDKLEPFEKQSLINLQQVTRRSIEVIDFLDQITFQGDIAVFVKFQRLLSSEILQTLATLKFQDLVCQQYNMFIRKILEAYLIIITPETAKVTPEMQGINVNNATRICNTLISSEDGRVFFGESILNQTLKEQNPLKRELLMKKGIEQILQQPNKIDLMNVVKILAEAGNFTSIVDICMRKAHYLENEEPKKVGYDQVSSISQIEEACGTVLSLFGAIDDSITYHGKRMVIDNKEYNSMMNLFLPKLQLLDRVEDKIELRNKIIKRIEQYRNQIVLGTLFNYLLSKPRDQIVIDSLPNLSRENFQAICDSSLKTKRMNIESFETLIKLMIKHQELERLALIIKQVLFNDFKLYMEKDENQFQTEAFLSSDKRLTYLIALENLLTTQKKKISQELYVQISSEVKEWQNLLDYQLLVVRSFEKKIRFINSYLNKEKIQQEERKTLEQTVNFLIEKLDEMEQQLRILNKIYNDYVDQCGLYDVQIYILLKKLNTSTENSYNQFIKDIEEAYQLLLEEKYKFFKPTWHQEVTDFLIMLINQDCKQTLKILFKITDRFNAKICKQDEESLVKEIIKVRDGYGLKDTRYWLIEFCFNTENMNLKLDEIINIFYGQSQASQQLGISSSLVQQFSQGPRKLDLDQALKGLVIISEWAKQNRKTFGNGTIGFSQNSLISANLGKKELFLLELRKISNYIWQNMLNKEIQNFINNNKLQFPVSISNAVEQLFNKVKNDFKMMCTQHQIALNIEGFLKPSLRESSAPAFSRNNTLITSQSPFQTKQSKIFEDVEDQQNRAATINDGMGFLPQRTIQGQSAFKDNTLQQQNYFHRMLTENKKSEKKVKFKNDSEDEDMNGNEIIKKDELDEEEEKKHDEQNSRVSLTAIRNSIRK